MRSMAAILVAILLAGCGGSADNGPESVAVDFIEAAFRVDGGAAWGTIHPALQATTSRAAFTACIAEDAEAAYGEVDVEAADTFVEGGVTFVDVRLSADGLFGDQEATLTLGLLEHADGWGIVTALGGDEDGGCFPDAGGVLDELLAA